MNRSVKERIQTHFNKSVEYYDENCTIQNAVCERSIELLLKHQQHFRCIADFACGTGESTRRLIQPIRYDTCYAVDFAIDLLTLAKKKLSVEKRIDFIQGDLDELLFAAPCLDLIFCNMGLQWSENLCKAIRQFYQYLNPGGLCLFSMPVAGNFPEIKPAFKLSLPCHETIIRTLIAEKFFLMECDKKTFSTSFINQFTLLKSLKKSGTNYNMSDSPCKSQGLSRIKLHSVFNKPENTQLTYKVGIYLARKKQS